MRMCAGPGRWGQQGAILIVSLILLLVLTLMGVFAMRGTTLEERMAGNMRDRDLAFQSAEAALRAAERDLIHNGFNSSDSGYYEADDMPDWANRTDDWSDGVAYPGVQLDGIAPGWPRFRVEAQPSFAPAPEPGTPVPSANMQQLGEYRIQARSRGGSGDSDAIIESGFLR